MTLSGECISPVCADARLYYLKLPRSKCDYDCTAGLRFNGAGLIGVDAIAARVAGFQLGRPPNG